MTYVTPYLPRLGEIAAREWMAGGKPAFVKAFEYKQDANCPNCQDNGVLYLVRADSGPHQHSIAGKVITWFDGDGRYGKGWYVMADTLAYECPECKKHPKREPVYVLPPKRPEQDMKRLGERMRR